MNGAVNIRAERFNRGLGIGEAAEQIGVSIETLKRAEKDDDHVPQPRNAFKIASFYGCKVTDIWPLEPEEAVA